MMILQRPTLKQPIYVYHDPAGRGSILLSEQREQLLDHQIFPHLLPLLDGRHTLQAMTDRLKGTFAPQDILSALFTLQKQGWLAHPPTRSNDFSRSSPPEPPETTEVVTTTTIQCYGSVDEAALRVALRTVKVKVVAENADLVVVFTDSYARPELQAVNDKAEQPWLLVKPVGTELWIGPLFVPGVSACWHCLAQRLHYQHKLAGYIAYQTGTYPVPTYQSPISADEMSANLELMQFAHHINGEVANHTLQDQIVSIDLQTKKQERHTVVKRPQCSACGTPVSEPLPISFQTRQVASERGGGLRGTLASETLAQYQHHVSPITGLVPALTPIVAGEGGYVYQAGYIRALAYRSWSSLQRSFRFHASGKGIDPTQAQMSALGEALERYSARFFGDEPYRMATYSELGEDAIHPSTLVHFSQRQYEMREAYNAQVEVNMVPERPFDETARIAWTKVWSLSDEKWKWIATQLCYLGTPPEDTPFYLGNTNGNAAGSSPEDAFLQGVLEVIERDSLALWWYNRIKRPSVNLNGFRDSFIEACQAHYAQMGREVWMLDITSDVGIPVFVALSRCYEGANDLTDLTIMGVGAHLDPQIAAIRALTEMNQSLANLPRGSSCEPAKLEKWLTPHSLLAAKLSEYAFLVPDPDQQPKQPSDLPKFDATDLVDAIQACLARVHSLGLEVLVHDLTRPDVGLPVVKVFIPQMRYYWRRLAPGRLYDVPVKLGWLEKPLAEADLNPLEFD